MSEPHGASAVDDLPTLHATLHDDLERAFHLLQELPPAITFFGGARIRPGDPYYEISKQIGRLLASTGIPPRTGGGPGIMHSVPEGFKEALAAHPAPRPVPPVIWGFSEHADPTDRRTQGVSIELPFETGRNPAIDRTEQLRLFPYRKLALYENVRGVVTFPGGFGTLDELFEVWSLAARGWHSDPLAVVGREFWGPILAAVARITRAPGRNLVNEADLERMFLTDDPEELLEHLTRRGDLRGFERDPLRLARTLQAELELAYRRLGELPAAMTVFGGRRLRSSDPILVPAQAVAQGLARAGVPIRLGGGGALSEAIADALGAVPGARSTLQAFVLGAEGGPLPEGVEPAAQVSELISHKELLERNSLGFLALPGGLGTLDEAFTVLCQMQTGKSPERPVVLLGSDYWQPLFTALRGSMLSAHRQTISPGDLERALITDDAEEALACLLRE